MTRTKEVDEFGNVSYTIRDGERIVGHVLKTGSSSYRAELPNGSWAPVGSIKGGMDWLARYAR